MTETGDGAIVHDATRLGADACPAWFDAQWWRTQGPVAAADGGRGSAWHVHTPAGPAVLRHYRRGGLIARFNRDRYFFRGAEATRAFREFRLLQAAQAARLPAPWPLAARYVRAGAWYRADLLVGAIADAVTLAQALAQSGASIPWRAIGGAIARFHAAGFLHADLNAHNVLLRDGQAWLIDFDRGERRAPEATWQQANLLRLRRSLDKLDAPQHVAGFAEEAWPALLLAHGDTLARLEQEAA